MFPGEWRREQEVVAQQVSELERRLRNIKARRLGFRVPGLGFRVVRSRECPGRPISLKEYTLKLIQDPSVSKDIFIYI